MLVDIDFGKQSINIPSKITSNTYLLVQVQMHLSNRAPEGFGNVKIGVQVICTDDLVLLAKEETVLQGMIDRLIEIGRYYEIKMNVEKTKVIKISRKQSPAEIMVDQKQMETVEYFSCLCSMIKNNARCTDGIK
jgi:hypothetical protein